MKKWGIDFISFYIGVMLILIWDFSRHEVGKGYTALIAVVFGVWYARAKQREKDRQK